MNYQPGRVTENIMVFSKSKACYTKNGNKMVYNPQLVKRDKPRVANAKIYGDGKAQLLHDYNTEDNVKTYEYRQPINIVKFNTVTKNKMHPTEKPVPLLEWLIKTYSNEGNLILDSCMGAGSTGVACTNTNRNFIGFEINDEYFNVARKRFDLTSNGDLIQQYFPQHEIYVTCNEEGYSDVEIIIDEYCTAIWIDEWMWYEDDKCALDYIVREIKDYLQK